MYNDQVAFEIGNIIGKQVNIKYINPTEHRPGLDLKYGLDGNKLKSFGWNQPFSFSESLQKTVLWSLDNPMWL
jgi:dTDP-D-glucose 4,6-dehydratase